MVLNRAVYSVGIAGAAFGAFLLFLLAFFYIPWYIDGNYAMMILASPFLVVGVVLVLVGWAVHRHDRNTAARPPAGGPAGPQNRPGPPAGIG